MKSKTKTLLSASTLSLLSLAVAGCNVTEPPPFNPRALQQPERAVASDVLPHPMRPMPTTLESTFLATARAARAQTRPTTAPTTGPVLGTEPVLRLTLQEVVQRAVANNLEVRVAGYDTAVDQTRVVEAQARFDPTFFANGQYERQDRLSSANIFPGGEPGEQKANIYTLASGIRQNMASGGQAELRYQTTINDNDPNTFSFNPFYQNELVLEITQPLLRDFGNEVNRARITIARLNQRISLLDFRKTLEEQITNTERAYWQLVLAERDVRILEGLLQRTVETADLLSRRQEQDVTRVQTSQANAAVESRRAVLVRARAHARDVSDQLKRLMNDPDLPVTSPTLLLPGSEPVEDAIHFDLTDQINTALENRFDLAQQQLRVDSASTVVRVAKQNLLPQLNLVGSGSVTGLGEDFNQAADRQGDFDFLNFKIGLQFEIPIGNRAARAIYSRSLLQRQQAVDQYRNLIEQTSLEVTQALREVRTTWDEMVTTRQARFAHADALLAIEQREKNNEPLTPTFVQLKLDTQAALAEAYRAEVTAITNYNTAIALLERAKGTLLRYNNILMHEEPKPFDIKLVEEHR